MNDFKSKLPDLKELSSMGGTLFNGLKTAVEQIIKEYKEKRTEPRSEASEKPVQKGQTASKPTTPKTASRKASAKDKKK